MDVTTELKDTGQDTTGQQNPQSESETASGVKQETSAKTIAKEATEKAVSDALSAAGRTDEVLKAREQAVKAAEEKAEERRKVRDAKELEDASEEDRPLIQRKQSLRTAEIAVKQREEAADRKEAANQVVVEAARVTEFNTDVFNVATEHGIKADKLKELSADLGITSLNLLQKLAKSISSKEAFRPDGGETLGGGEDTSNLSPREKIDKGNEEAKKKGR